MRMGRGIMQYAPIHSLFPYVGIRSTKLSLPVRIFWLVDIGNDFPILRRCHCTVSEQDEGFFVIPSASDDLGLLFHVICDASDDLP